MSHDGRRIALFRTVGEFVELAIVTRDGNITESALTLPGGFVYSSPRWSNDDRTIACQRGSPIAFEMSVCVRSVRSGIFTPIASAGWIQGLCWLPDDSGLVYSSSLGSTLLYPPVFNLRSVTADGALDSQLTFGDGSYVEPDSHSSGRLVATLVKTQSDVWRFATEGTPRKNTRGTTRITAQTGQVQVPSASPDDRQIVTVRQRRPQQPLGREHGRNGPTSDHFRRGSACLHRRTDLGPCRKPHRVRSGPLGTRRAMAGRAGRKRPPSNRQQGLVSLLGS